ncbi:hypothetical protein GCM10017673_32520 [Streptosporangium violaceochromogenes]|nr:hypothetical protein GCM10017673_32520 [Streptosporangium violaceochromogenes]
MIPEIHMQLINQRAAELRREAAEYRRAREARVYEEKHSPTGRRRGFLAKLISA